MRKEIIPVDNLIDRLIESLELYESEKRNDGYIVTVELLIADLKACLNK